MCNVFKLLLLARQSIILHVPSCPKSFDDKSKISSVLFSRTACPIAFPPTEPNLLQLRSTDFREVLTCNASPSNTPPSGPIELWYNDSLFKQVFFLRASPNATPPSVEIHACARCNVLNLLLLFRAFAMASPPLAPILFRDKSRNSSDESDARDPLSAPSPSKVNSLRTRSKVFREWLQASDFPIATPPRTPRLHRDKSTYSSD
mmetsp:Transcript_13228/g.21506  ORF Transcript_13228/g.21506 Transcript_13228/m.21506 type:complete len:204 (-) Transcript_13228:1515-2126(-)